jgi:2-dehydropantoate 2-reductase
MNQKPRVLIVGCGGIGGVIAGRLAAAGQTDLCVMSSNVAIAEAVQAHGLRLTGTDGELTAKLQIFTDVPSGSFDFILLATQPTQVEDAAAQCIDALCDTGALVVLQNGLCESRIAALCGIDRVLGGIVTFGASSSSPGHVERTSKGGMVIGRLDGVEDARVTTLAELLAPVGPISQTKNLIGARFSKLALNCAVSGLGTVAGVPLGTLLSDPVARNLALAVMREAVAVSRAEDIDLEPISGTFDLNWLASPEAVWSGPHHWTRHAMLLAVGFKYRKLRSSMLRAIERGRPPAVDFLNGEVVSRGQAHQIPTPINSGVTDIVHKIATGELSPSPEHLQSLQALHTHHA